MAGTIRHTGAAFILLLFLFLSNPFSAQINRSILRDAHRLTARFGTENSFGRALFYLERENWDSVLVFSMKQLYRHGPGILRDYCHFFRATAFRNKHLLQRSETEFRRIPSGFAHYYKVRICLAELALEKNRFRKALGYYRQLEKEIHNAAWEIDHAAFYHDMGLCYFHLQQYPQAEAYLFKGSRLRTAAKDTAGLVASFMDIGNLYYEQYKDELAIPWFLDAYRLSKRTRDLRLRQTAALNMAVVEENRKNYPQALGYRKEYETWTDSLSDQNKIWSVAEVEKKFAVSQKQKQVDVLRARNAVRNAERNTFIYSSVLLALLLAGVVYFYAQRIRRSRIILKQKTELDMLNATKDKLFSIVSHDLRSSVHALKTSNTVLMDQLETQNYGGLDEQLRHNSAIANGTYGLLDNLLHWALLQTEQYYFRPEPLLLHRLTEQVAFNYRPMMAVKNIRFENRVAKDLRVFADAESCKLLLRNLVDNSIKFTPENGRIDIYTRGSDPAFCTLVVEDSGTGITAAVQEELLRESVLLSKKHREETIGTGLGLQLCKSVIRKNNGRLGIESEPRAGTKLIVSLPKTNEHG